MLALKKVKVVVIQRYWRGFVARRRANEKRQRNMERDFKVIAEKEEILRIQKEKRDEG